MMRRCERARERIGERPDLDIRGSWRSCNRLEMAEFSPARLYEMDKHLRYLRTNADWRNEVMENAWTSRRLIEPHRQIRLLQHPNPCQPFSLGGKHLADHDGRNLFPEVTGRSASRPVAVLENVMASGHLPAILRVRLGTGMFSVRRDAEKPGRVITPGYRRQECSGHEPEYHVACAC